ncbi:MULTISPECIES: GNAT family N-acetyltransferase [Nocardia]|uniref:GNAT family N-acetyltransferase n=1 Tax=Nocardia TaxID=1817 RepID=UPI0007EC19BD|nr:MULTISPECIES: GNAT family N-acetyltransferase [Nocardia]MBF6272898.1 GNAT family N-acetyltransferase [Nocardia nova]OBA52983.1 acetyltransferase [Nocardia sp. 852002-51101_SCH5132738]OBB49114.1 acetyltransferase [Nocardia sp. 852002-51244_SCH5132740]
MRIEPLSVPRIGEVIDLMGTGAPYITPRTSSDYWLYATLFSTTCPLAVVDGAIAGAVIAFRSQDDPADIYLQDVITHPDYRRRGITRALIASVADHGIGRGCRRLYLTSEPDNHAAHTAWIMLGFTNVAGDHTIGEVSVITDFKGPGKTRAVYEKLLS